MTWLQLASELGAPPPAFVKFSIVDRTAPALEYLQAIVDDLEARMAAGENLYVHCWAGRGRAALVGGCLLAQLRGMGAIDALDFVGAAYHTRGESARGRLSPETLEQRRLLARFVLSLEARRGGLPGPD